MDTLIQDLRYSLRLLVKHRGFTTIAVLALALGIGANTAIFSVVEATLLKPLPFVEPDRLVAIRGQWKGDATATEPASLPDFVDWRAQATSIDAMAAWNRTSAVLTGDDEPVRMVGMLTSASLFPLLGVGPAIGRPFTAEEDRPGAVPVVLLSHGFWSRRFGADPAVVGRQVTLGGQSTTVVGVMPAGFNFPPDGADRDYWAPLESSPQVARWQEQRGAHFLNVLARLKPGSTLEQASSELNAIARELERQYPDSNDGLSIRLIPLLEDLVGSYRPALLVLLGAVGLVLLIACANVANLLLVRAGARQKELAIRAALGAGRGRIVRQMLTESGLLALAGGGLGLLLAMWGIDVLIASSPLTLPRIREAGLDATVLVFTTGVSALTGVLFGLVPALQVSRPDVQEILKESARGATQGLRRNRLRSALVAAEIALSLVLLVGAGLLLKSFSKLLDESPGFDPAGITTAGISLPASKYPDAASRRSFYDRLFTRLEAIPGTAAAGIFPLPLSGSTRATGVYIVGEVATDRVGERDSHEALEHASTAGYFRTMGIPLLRGRDFAAGDAPESTRVMIVNDAFARRLFPGQDPLGKRVHLGDGDPVEIVGVVGDVRHRALNTAPELEFYRPFSQAPEASMTLVMRPAAGQSGLLPALRAAVLEVDPGQPISRLRSMEELVAESVGVRRFNTLLIGLFSGLALLLAAIGIYGVMAWSVSQRTQELGIRIALGAKPGDIVGMVVKQGLALAALGVCVGLILAVALSGVMSGLLYAVSPTDPLVLAGITALLVAVALAASIVPALRATRIDPVLALRAD